MHLQGVTNTGLLGTLLFLSACSTSNDSSQQQIKKSSNDSRQQQIKKRNQTQFDIVDFIDNTMKYKGKQLTIPVIVEEPIFRDDGRSLRDCIGRTVKFYSFGPNTDTRLDIVILLPRDLSVPNACYGDEVKVTFVCKEGNLQIGNEAKAIVRP